MENLALSLINGFAYVIPQLLILVAVLYYLSKKVSPEGVLMVIGEIITLLCMIINILMPYFIGEGLINYSENYLVINSVIGLIAFTGSLLFAIGLFMLVNQIVKKNLFRSSDA